MNPYTHRVVRRTPAGEIWELFKFGQPLGTFFVQFRRVPRGACFNVGVNGRYVHSTEEVGQRHNRT